MKLVMDERVKHRIIGLAVIFSIAAIFAPAVIKKSNQRMEDNVDVAVQLPPKPKRPNVVMPKEQELFNTVKVAHVEIPSMPVETMQSAVAQAESLSKINEIKPAIKPMVNKAKEELVKVAKQKPAIVAAAEKGLITASKTEIVSKSKVEKEERFAKNNRSAAAQIAKPPLSSPIKTERYAVQLATFSKQQNANSLISKLKAKGYKASYNQIKTAEGTVYKVIVGDNPKEEAQRLQQQLANSMQLKGFLVSTGIG